MFQCCVFQCNLMLLLTVFVSIKRCNYPCCFLGSLSMCQRQPLQTQSSIQQFDCIDSCSPSRGGEKINKNPAVASPTQCVTDSRAAASASLLASDVPAWPWGGKGTRRSWAPLSLPPGTRCTSSILSAYVCSVRLNGKKCNMRCEEKAQDQTCIMERSSFLTPLSSPTGDRQTETNKL